MNIESGTQPKGQVQATIYSSGKRSSGTYEAKESGRPSVWKANVKVAGNDDRPDQDYDPVQLADGIRVEMEHTNDPEIAKMIAKDHLDEFDNYYTSLKKMENSLRKAGLSFNHIIPYDINGITKAKVYINHPSEAPKGRAVRMGNKGGYYYITSDRGRGGQAATSEKKQASKKKSRGGTGWQVGGDSQGEPEPTMPPEPPIIDLLKPPR